MRIVICECCKQTMQERTGKFGVFYFCSNGHGTKSFKQFTNAGRVGEQVFATGEIYKYFKQEQETRYNLLYTEGQLAMYENGCFNDLLNSVVEEAKEASNDAEDHGSPEHWTTGRVW